LGRFQWAAHARSPAPFHVFEPPFCCTARLQLDSSMLGHGDVTGQFPGRRFFLRQKPGLSTCSSYVGRGKRFPA